MTTKEKDRFRVLMPCKGYVRSYLLANFNRPDEDWPEIVNFAPDKALHDYFLSLLRKGEEHNDSRLKGTRYKSMVWIEITYDQFTRYGWMLSMTDIQKMNTFLEHRVKLMLYSFVGALRMTGIPLMSCIMQFRLRTGITEWMWDTDSIRKDLQRHLHYDPTAFNEFLQKIEEKVWRTLSENGTLTEQGLETYLHKQ